MSESSAGGVEEIVIIPAPASMRGIARREFLQWSLGAAMLVPACQHLHGQGFGRDAPHPRGLP